MRWSMRTHDWAENQAIQVEELEQIGVAPTVYREEDMSALESSEPTRASV